VQSLNGTWKFKLFEGLTVPAEYTDWKNPAFDVGPWDNIAVPGNWETQGFKIPEYGRDLGEYTGLYRTSFKYNPAWKSKNVILRFDGVHFGYECYINGTKAGEHGSAFNMCQFDITPFLNMESDNILCVKVSSRSFGWLFDTNDCWSLVGITRDVELFALDNVYLEDMTFVSEVTPESDAIVKVRVDVNRFRENRSAYKLNISLSDPLNNHILDFSRPIDPNVKVYDFEGILRQPKLWTAETPNLYRIEVCIVDDKGYVVQRINERIGVRSVYVDGFDLKVNHKPVLLRGVCVNEIDPQLGRALTYKERRKQLEKMKAANINFIRTAHYPFGPDFLQLCDEMGFYVCNEIPFGSRGAENLEKEEYLPELIERADATLRRDKNRPSVIIWSLGNENPYTPIVEKVLEYVSIKDPGRPRGLPQKTGDFMKFTKNPSPNVDIIMGHYLSDSRISEAVKNTSKPIIHTEYAHSLGLAFEDLEAKYSRILNEEKVVGGSIWCWSDQTVMTLGDNQKNKILKSVWIDSMRFMDSYGRSEVAEGKREVWKEAADGIVYGDGYPQEDFYEVRKVYSPVIINTDKLNAKSGASNVFDLDIESRFDFISLHGYKIDWKVCNVRRILESGEVWLQTPAGMQDKVSMHVDLPENVDFNDLMLSMEILDPSGKSIYEKTLPIEIIGHSKDYRSLVEVLPEAKKSKNRISKTMASVGADDVHFELTGKGVLKIKDGKDRQIIETPLYLRVGRPLSITLDYLAQKDTFYWNPYILTPVIEGFETSEQKDGVQIRLACRWNRIEKPEEYVSGIVVVDMRSNGTVNLDYDIIPSENASGNFLECGLLLKLNPSFDVFRWLGAGPFSYTPGKTAYNERSCWAVHKDDIRFAGNRGLVDIAVITDQQRGVGLWSENGYVGIENINGSIHVSQNALVTGYGSKFTEPGNRIPMNDLKSIKGSFVLFVDQPEKPVTFFDLIFKSDKSYPTVVPEQPYMKSYGR
jgi:beta-galactosidase